MLKIMRKKDGFSILEILVAIALLGVVTFPLVILYGSSLNVVTRSRDIIEINSIARQVKVDVYNAFYNQTNNIELYKAPDPNQQNQQTDKTNVYENNQLKNQYYGILLDGSTIHKGYRYQLIKAETATATATGNTSYTRSATLVEKTTAPAFTFEPNVISTQEIRLRVDIFKADALGNFNDKKIDKSFFLNIPTKFFEKEG